MKVQKSGVVLLAALALLATGCRGGEAEGGGDGEVSAPGVSSEACPEAVNADNGCIYLGSISDLTAGPFAPLGVPITDAQKAFWQTVIVFQVYISVPAVTATYGFAFTASHLEQPQVTKGSCPWRSVPR